MMAVVPTTARFIDEAGRLLHTGLAALVFRGAVVGFPDAEDVYEVRSVHEFKGATEVTVRRLPDGY